MNVMPRSINCDVATRSRLQTRLNQTEKQAAGFQTSLNCYPQWQHGRRNNSLTWVQILMISHCRSHFLRNI